jgi:hypothetical protein
MGENHCLLLGAYHLHIVPPQYAQEHLLRRAGAGCLRGRQGRLTAKHNERDTASRFGDGNASRAATG